MFRAADWLKSGQGHLVSRALGPIGLAAMQGLNFGLRYDYLMKSYAADPWGGLENVLFCPDCPLSWDHAGLLADGQRGASAELVETALALPIPERRYSAPSSQAFLILCVSCLLLSISTAMLGIILGMGQSKCRMDRALALYSYLRRSHAGLSAVALIDTQEPGDRGRNRDYRLRRIDVCPAIPRLDAAKVAALAYMGPGEVKVIGGLLGAVITCVGLIHFNRKDVD